MGVSGEKKAAIARRLLISGRVQGVGYRYNMQQQATRLGLMGWCRNLPDGRVEAEGYGCPQQVEALIEWAQRGPSGAIVDAVAQTDLPSLEAFKTLQAFEIRH